NPQASLLSGPVPGKVSVSTDLEGLLRAVGKEHQFDQPGTDVRIVDSLANLRPITVIRPRLQASGPMQDCGWEVSGSWQRLGTLTDPGGGVQVVHLGYMT